MLSIDGGIAADVLHETLGWLATDRRSAVI